MFERFRTSLAAAALAGVYAAAVVLGGLAPAGGGRFAIMLLPAGLAAGALFRWGPGWWPVLACAGALAAWLLGSPPAAAAGYALLTTLGAVATAWLLRRLGFEGDFGRPRDVARFALGIGLGAAVSAAAWSAGWIAQYGAGHPALRELPGRWWLDTTLSLLLVVPFVLVTNRGARVTRAARPPEIVAWALFLAAMLATVLGLPPEYIGIPVFAGVLVALAWSVTRMNLWYAVLAAFAGALTSAISASFQLGLLADDPVLRAQRLAWNAGFLYGVIALCLNAYLSAHERAERRYRMLFQESPEPMWLADPATERILDVNAAAIAVYGYPRREFLELRVPEIVVPSERGADTLADGTHQLHRRRDGGLLRVYARTRALRLDDRDAELWFNVDVTERTELRSALRRAASEERARVSRELHDGLGQELTGIAFVLGGMATQVRRGTPVGADELARVADFARSALESCRRIVRGLSPVDVGATLPQALQSMVARLDGGAARISLRVDSQPAELDTPGYVAEQLLRISQEALANALRHSGARNIDVHLRRTEHGVTLAVRDDGCGFDPSAVRRGMGLRTLRVRAEEIGAVLTVDAAPGRGVCVECRYFGAPAAA